MESSLVQMLASGGDIATLGILVFLVSHHKDIQSIMRRLSKIEEKL